MRTAETREEIIREYANPAPLRATISARRRTGRQMARRIPGSRGWRASKAKVQRLDRRCVHLRQEAAHQLTTELASTYGQIVIEDLNLAAMKRAMGRRAFRRSVSDAALGRIRPQLACKTKRHGNSGPDPRNHGSLGSARKTARHRRVAARDETRTRATATVATEPRKGCIRNDL